MNADSVGVSEEKTRDRAGAQAIGRSAICSYDSEVGESAATPTIVANVVFVISFESAVV
ncbi:MAG: hypothetical protein JNK05_11170 [Myxococcales bacterium]|nr:hypothetical protein [Myxococcales bacterium]